MSLPKPVLRRSFSGIRIRPCLSQSNRLASAVFYGIVAGCEPAVYGDPMVLQDEDQTFGGHARVRRQWAELHGEAVDVGLARVAAADELGAASVLGPIELASVLGWVAP